MSGNCYRLLLYHGLARGLVSIASRSSAPSIHCGAFGSYSRSTSSMVSNLVKGQRRVARFKTLCISRQSSTVQVVRTETRAQDSTIAKKKEEVRTKTGIEPRLESILSSGDTSPYGCKSTRDLLRASLVFRLCSIDFLVNHQLKILGWMRRLLGKSLFAALMKSTVYGQFVAGDQSRDVLEAARSNALGSHFQALFAYTAAEYHGPVSGRSSADMDNFWKVNFDETKRAIKIAKEAKQFLKLKPKVASKVTFFAEPEFLIRISNVILHNIKFIKSCEVKSGENFKVTKADEILTKVIRALDDHSQTRGLFCANECQSKLHLDSCLTNMAFHVQLNRILQEGDPALKPDQSLVITDIEQLKRLTVMMEELAKAATSEGVHFIVDAEQTYLQPAIDVLTVDLMRQFNSTQPIVFSTYQCYLKRTHDNLTTHQTISAREGFCLGAKLVRGAYMDEERRLANEHNYEDPINDTFDLTTAMYHRVSDTMIAYMKAHPDRNAHVLFATHNEQTVDYLHRALSASNLPMVEGNISFGQLQGMRDYITISLANKGYMAAKMLHFGPVEQVTAYLSRRLLENKSSLPSANKERSMLSKELRRRIWTKRKDLAAKN